MVAALKEDMKILLLIIGRIVDLSKIGKPSHEIAAILTIGKSTVNDIMKKYHSEKSLEE